MRVLLKIMYAMLMAAGLLWGKWLGPVVKAQAMITSANAAAFISIGENDELTPSPGLVVSEFPSLNSLQHGTCDDVVDAYRLGASFNHRRIFTNEMSRAECVFRQISNDVDTDNHDQF